MCKTECRPVLAYKSLNESYYESATECANHNKIWKEQKIREEIKRIFDWGSGGSLRMPNSYSGYDSFIENGRLQAISKQSEVWRVIRDKLNAIQDT